MEKSKLANAHSCAGKSIIELLWEDMDRVVDILSGEGRPDEVPPRPTVENQRPLAAWRDEWMAYGETRGQAQGLAYALALLLQGPGTDGVNVPRIKKIAAERLEERNR